VPEPTYESKSYWTDRGERYRDEHTKRTLRERYAFFLQERALLAYLRKLEFASVLEVGCGYGRITRKVYDAFRKPTVALDLSPHQVENARRLCGARPIDLRVGSIFSLPFPDESQDLVLVSEVLMHLPPAEITSALEEVLRVAKRHVVHVDWREEPYGGFREAGSPPYCFEHDYARLYGELGEACEATWLGPRVRQSIFHVAKR
jgi:SAM-dependent methyltransferase